MWIGNTSCLAKVRKASTRANGISDPVLLAICFLTQPWHPHHFTAGPLSILPRIPFVAWHGPALKKKTEQHSKRMELCLNDPWDLPSWQLNRFCHVQWDSISGCSNVLCLMLQPNLHPVLGPVGSRCPPSNRFFSIAFPNITDVAADSPPKSTSLNYLASILCKIKFASRIYCESTWQIWSKPQSRCGTSKSKRLYLPPKKNLEGLKISGKKPLWFKMWHTKKLWIWNPATKEVPDWRYWDGGLNTCWKSIRQTGNHKKVFEAIHFLFMLCEHSRLSSLYRNRLISNVHI